MSVRFNSHRDEITEDLTNRSPRYFPEECVREVASRTIVTKHTEIRIVCVSLAFRLTVKIILGMNHAYNLLRQK